MYLNETVVEEHSDHGGAIAGVLGDGLHHDALDDGLRLGALVVVVADLQWPERAGLAPHSEEQQGTSHQNVWLCRNGRHFYFLEVS